jgi:hypothetical protein
MKNLGIGGRNNTPKAAVLATPTLSASQLGDFSD